MPPSPPPRPLPLPPEAPLAQAEAELAEQEARLAEALARAEASRGALARQLAQARAQAEEARQRHGGSPRVAEVCARVEGTSVPELGGEEARERALRARTEALETRRAALRERQEALGQAGAQVRAAAEALQRAEEELEAAVWAERERMAREERERAAARALEAARQRAAAAPRPTRVALQAVIDLRSDSNFFTGFSTNLSEGGVFIATVQRVPQGTPVDLTLTLPEGRTLEVRGVVRWSREVNDREPQLMPGLGVQFAELPPETARTIADFVATREPLFFPD